MSKLYLAFFLIISLFIFSSCKDEVNPIQTASSGGLKLSIDKENAPSIVFYVKATLTRTNHSDVTSTLNLKTDSLADITIEKLEAGQWHLKIEALDSSLAVKYLGETDVNIKEDDLTEVFLTLTPVPSSQGEIFFCNKNDKMLSVKGSSTSKLRLIK